MASDYCFDLKLMYDNVFLGVQSSRTTAYFSFCAGGTEEGTDSSDQCVRLWLKAQWWRSDQLLINRQRGVWTIFILCYQALSFLWSLNLKYLKAESNLCHIFTISDLTTPLTFTPSIILCWGLKLRHRRCSFGFCPSTAVHLVHLRRRSYRPSCWSSAREDIRQWRLKEGKSGEKDNQ